MGRTNLTYRDVLRALDNQWSDYRRGLRREDQQRFDQLFAYIRAHADASGYLNHTEPFYPARPLSEEALEAPMERVEGGVYQLPSHVAK